MLKHQIMHCSRFWIYDDLSYFFMILIEKINCMQGLYLF